jgi:hypothetical protein
VTGEVEVRRNDIVFWDGYEVRVRIVENVDRESDWNGTIATTVTAAVPGCGPLHLRATAGSYVIALGRQDAATGHARFDDRYIVKTNDVELMRFWLDDAQLEAMLATYHPAADPAFSLELDDARVTLTAARGYPSGLHSIIRVDEAINAAACIGTRAERLAVQWRERATALGGTVVGSAWTGDDAFSLAVPRGRHPIRIDFPYAVAWAARQSVRTRVWCPRREPGPPVAALAQPDLPRASTPRLAKLDGEGFSIGTCGGKAATDRPPSVEAIDARAIDADIDWIVIDETSIAAGWEKIVEQPAELTAGIDLVAALADWLAPAHAPDGPYR